MSLLFIWIVVLISVWYFYRGADKSLGRPGRRQANVSVRMAWISFVALPCRKKNDDSSRLDVVEIARVPDVLPRLFPSWSGYGLISTPVIYLITVFTLFLPFLTLSRNWAVSVYLCSVAFEPSSSNWPCASYPARQRTALNGTVLSADSRKYHLFNKFFLNNNDILIHFLKLTLYYLFIFYALKICCLLLFILLRSCVVSITDVIAVVPAH